MPCYEKITLTDLKIQESHNALKATAGDDESQQTYRLHTLNDYTANYKWDLVVMTGWT